MKSPRVGRSTTTAARLRPATVGRRAPLTRSGIRRVVDVGLRATGEGCFYVGPLPHGCAPLHSRAPVSSTALALPATFDESVGVGRVYNRGPQPRRRGGPRGGGRRAAARSKSQPHERRCKREARAITTHLPLLGGSKREKKGGEGAKGRGKRRRRWVGGSAVGPKVRRGGKRAIARARGETPHHPACSTIKSTHPAGEARRRRAFSRSIVARRALKMLPPEVPTKSSRRNFFSPSCAAEMERGGRAASPPLR